MEKFLFLYFCAYIPPLAVSHPALGKVLPTPINIIIWRRYIRNFDSSTVWTEEEKRNTNTTIIISSRSRSQDAEAGKKLTASFIVHCLLSQCGCGGSYIRLLQTRLQWSSVGTAGHTRRRRRRDIDRDGERQRDDRRQTHAHVDLITWRWWRRHSASAANAFAPITACACAHVRSWRRDVLRQ